MVVLMQKIMICPSEYKKKILLEEEKNDSLHSMKFYSKKDFFEHYYFSYDWKSVSYLISKYHYPVDVCLTYLNYLYPIHDIEYSSSKLCFLRDLKKELMNENLLTFSPSFHEYLKNTEIEVASLYDLERYEEEVLSYKVEVDEVSLSMPVYQFSTMEDEIHFVCVKIRELFQKGIPFSKIFLCNVSEDSFFSLEKMFSYYQIPIEIPHRDSIYSSQIVQQYLKTGEISISSSDPIVKLLCDALAEVAELEEGDAKREILIEILKNTYLSNPSYEEAVCIKDIYTYPFSSDDYVFVLGFNQDILPTISKDTDYLSDLEKEEIGIYPSTYVNVRRKKVLASIFSKISHLVISYPLSSPFQQYYPSSMIQDYDFSIIREDIVDKEYSHLYNQLRLGEYLDQFYLYGEKHPSFHTFASKYSIPYRQYQSTFGGISRNLYLQQLDYPFKLSYTALNTYQECQFHYYLQYVLKLGEFEDTFAATIGSLYHKVLSLYQTEGFSLDEFWNRYLEEKNLSLKDTVLLVRVRRDLETLLEELKRQKSFTMFQNEYLEQKLEVKVRDDIYVVFVGYLDKIMTYQNVSDTYFAIVDYKTGFIDTHLEPMKYGLHMQLPIYLYLLTYSKFFENPIFTGIYYQNILFSYPTWSDKVEKEKKDSYQLKGYSTDQLDILSKFDSTYLDSELIKGLKYDPTKGFSHYSKIMDDEFYHKILSYTKKEIEDRVEDILQANFSINPKIYGKENISCEFCPYKDICFHEDRDLVYLDKVEDFDFLGGDQ